MKIKHFIPQVMGLTLLLLLVREGMSQAAPVVTTNDSTAPNNSVNPLTDGLGGGLNPMDLLHKVQTTPSRGSDEFDSDSQKNIETAADKFKKQQMQQMQNNSSTSH